MTDRQQGLGLAWLGLDGTASHVYDRGTAGTTPSSLAAKEPGMIILGIVLLIVGFLAGISILWTIGIILVVVGVVLFALGAAGHAVGGRRHYY